MIPPPRMRRPPGGVSEAVMVAFHIAARTPGGLFSTPSAPISFRLSAGTPADALEEALRDARIRESVPLLQSNRKDAYRVVKATIRKSIRTSPQSGTVLEPYSRFWNLDRFRGGALCVYIELTSQSSEQLQPSEISVTSAKRFGPRRSKRKRSSGEQKAFVTDFESNVTVPDTSRRKRGQADSQWGMQSDSDDYVVPSLPVYNCLFPGQDAILCGLLDALAEEGRLLFPKSVEGKLMGLFEDVSAFLVHLQKYWDQIDIRNVVPGVLLSVMEENDRRPYSQRVVSEGLMSKDEERRIVDARQKLNCHPLLSPSQLPKIKVSTSCPTEATMNQDDKTTDACGGELWLRSELRQSIISFLKNIPESSQRTKSEAGQKEAVNTQQGSKKRLEGDATANLEGEESGLFSRRRKRLRKIPARYIPSF